MQNLPIWEIRQTQRTTIDTYVVVLINIRCGFATWLVEYMQYKYRSPFNNLSQTEQF